MEKRQNIIYVGADKPVRSVAKTISWRIIGLLVTCCIGYAMTREFSKAALIGGFDACIKIVIFYLHERAWCKISFGTVCEPAPGSDWVI